MNRAFVLCAVIILGGCKQMPRISTAVIHSSGISKSDQEFSDLFFVSDSEAYLFGTQTKSSNAPLPGFHKTGTPLFVAYEANIFKTTDSGRTWAKIDSSLQRENYGNVAYDMLNQTFWLCQSAFYKNHAYIKSFPTKPAIESKEYVLSSLYCLFNDDKNVLFSAKDGIYNAVTKARIFSDPGGNHSLSTDGLVFSILPDGDYNTLFQYSKAGGKKVWLPISPEQMTKILNTTLILAGRSIADPSQREIISFDIRSKRIQRLLSLPKASFVEDLHANDGIICFFSGTISESVTTYTLKYSIDGGETWHQGDLYNNLYASPSHLIGRTLIVFSGNSSFEKITFMK